MEFLDAEHYHVLCGLRGGYLPDGNDICLTKQDAIETAKQHKEILRDSQYSILGNIRNDLCYIWGWDSSNYHSIIEIVECADSDCILHFWEG